MRDKSLISVSFLNIGGINSSVFGPKLSSLDFVNVISKYDVNIVGETWGSNPNFDSIHGYTPIVIKPNKHNAKKGGRESGGLVVWYKNELAANICVLKRGTNCIWLKVCNIIVGGFYIPPASSKYYENDLFGEISNGILEYGQNNLPILLVGDFNARTATLNGFVDSNGDQYTQTEHLNSEIVSSRQSCDSEVNSHGHALLEICKTHNLRILNGRKEGDSFGNSTFSNHKGSSVVDYAIVSDQFFSEVTGFTVKPQTILSDHCQLVTWFNSPLISKRKEESTYDWIPLPRKFKWLTNSKSTFTRALREKNIQEKIQNFLTYDFSKTTDVDRANTLFTNIIISAADMSLPVSKGNKRKCHKKGKKWFDNECVALKKDFNLLSKRRHQKPHDENIKMEQKQASKTLRSTCFKKKQAYWNNVAEQLENNTDNNQFWDTWTSFDDKYQSDSQPRLTNGNVWEQYYAKLFHENNDLKLPKERNKTKKDHQGPALNKQISDKEIQKSVQRLKKGKSPGFDRISNEMIIASYPIMKDVFHKLFNFIFSCSNAPEIWCKSIISPIHKSGNKLDPDNYRPISVTSCLSKLFCIILNFRLSDFLKDNKILSNSQIGFLEETRTVDHVFTLKTLINKHVHNTPKGKIFACFIDFRKAYDSVCHKALFQKLSDLNISDNFIDVLKNMYSKTTCAVKIGDSRTKFVDYTKGVRQGCPLSPLLFNTFINDLAETLEDKSLNPFILPNGSNLNCLMYADDIVIFSKTADGLQSLIDKVQVYCDTWKMNLNVKKTKCITFQKKNRTNKKNTFMFGNKEIESVSSFNYLGMTINANGSLHSSMENLSCKAQRAVYALNNRFPIKRLPIKAALKLFDSVVTPILLYGSEIWGTYNYLSFEKWDKCDMERVHLNFCKRLLGVNRSTTNILVRGELGRYPLKLNVENRIKSFFDHVKKAPEDSLIYQAYLMNLELPPDLNCSTHIQNVKRNLNLEDFHSCTKSMFKLSQKTSYNRYWTREMSSSKKGEFLFRLKKGIILEPYLMQHNKRKLRVITTKLRLSDHCLAIETGRRQSPKIDREDRVCQICNEEFIEDEKHFLLKCEHYSVVRDTFLNQVFKSYPSTKQLNSDDLLQFMFLCEDQETIDNLLKFIGQITDIREKTLLFLNIPKSL